MAFSLNEDQTLLKDAADGFFSDNAPVASFRKLRDSKETLDPSLWGEIGAMGFAGASCWKPKRAPWASRPCSKLA
jgi:acyl-CoA dehydrogenase